MWKLMAALLVLSVLLGIGYVVVLAAVAAPLQSLFFLYVAAAVCAVVYLARRHS